MNDITFKEGKRREGIRRRKRKKTVQKLRNIRCQTDNLTLNNLRQTEK